MAITETQEQISFAIQSIGEMIDSIDPTSSNVEMQIQLIENLLIEIEKKINAVLDTNLMELLEGSKINYIKTENVIVKPGEKDSEQQIDETAKSSEKLKKVDLGLTKIKELIKVLEGLEINFKTVSVIEGIAPAGSIKRSYLYFDIPELNSVVLINPEHEQSTFVIGGQNEPEKIFNSTKDELQIKFGATRRQFRRSAPHGFRRNIHLDLLTNLADSDKSSEELHSELVKDYIDAVKAKFKTAEAFIEVKSKTLDNLFFYGKNITRVGTVVLGQSGLKIAKNRLLRLTFAKVVYRDLGEKYEAELKMLREYSIQAEEFKEMTLAEQRQAFIDKYPNPDELFENPKGNRRSLVVFGMNLDAVAKILIGNKKIRPTSSNNDLAVFLDMVHPVRTKTLEEYLKKVDLNKDTGDWSKERWIQEIMLYKKTAEEFMAMTGEEMRNFRIEGKGLLEIAHILFNRRVKNITSSKIVLAEFAELIYGQGHQCIEEQLELKRYKKETKNWDNEKWRIEFVKANPDFEYFLNCEDKKEIYTFRFKGVRLKQLNHRLFGNGKDPATVRAAMLEFLSKMYQVEFKE